MLWFLGTVPWRLGGRGRVVCGLWGVACGAVCLWEDRLWSCLSVCLSLGRFKNEAWVRCAGSQRWSWYMRSRCLAASTARRGGEQGRDGKGKRARLGWIQGKGGRGKTRVNLGKKTTTERTMIRWGIDKGTENQID